MSGKKDSEQALWDSYISGMMDREEEERLEALLLQDDEVFKAYAAVLSSQESTLPEPEEEELYLQRLLGAIPQEKARPVQTECRKTWSRHPLFHYTVAAAITVLLMGCGLFDSLSSGTSEWINRPQQSIPLSERMLDMTVKWVDTWRR
ncbi:hypothetical protein [Paenibacillus sanguinis]|uniref:hypothetical protein n=1 Tax=Paenibacillus sanguinis TaxID=225906 RepID=UPI00036D88D3|nr:hypothetical protein [Paenibacillus sanguinis]